MIDITEKADNREFGLYIHIPFCVKKCSYCDFPSYSGMEAYWDAYLDAVLKELEHKSSEFGRPIIKTIFVGGGTPSILPPSHICRMFESIKKNFRLRTDCETTIESNPGTITDEKMKIYAESGINRLSMGLQAAQERILKFLGRIHTFEDFKKAVFLAQKHGLTNINADIIFGIPDQTFEDFKETTEQILKHYLTHISCYSLKIEEGTVFGRMHEEGRLSEVDDELDRRMYHYAVEKFLQSGFPQYEISNFAKPQYVCKHNMNYWERGEYIGVGAGAHSLTDDKRYANTSEVTSYIEAMNKGMPTLSEESKIPADEALSEKIILGLRLNRGIDLERISNEYGIDVQKRFGQELHSLLKQKLVEQTGSMVRLTKKGLDLANQVFVKFI